MKTKNFLASGFAGGIVYFLLGWLLYGILFKDYLPSQAEESMQVMLMIFLGCLTYGFFIAYIFGKWAQISTALTGLKAGIVIAIFISLFYNFFHMAMNPDSDFMYFAMDTLLTIISSAITGAVIGMIYGKMNS